MKKSLIAAAVLAASGAAMAQNATVYGVVDLWMGSIKNGVGTDSLTKLDAGGVSGNRWGLKGSEDLGGGLKANFVLEAGFDTDTGTGTAGFARQSYISLSGGFGEVAFGNVYSAYDDISGATQYAFDSALSTANWIWGSVNYTARPKNNIKYSSPTFGGVSGSISYSLDEVNNAKLNTTSMQVNYADGPVYVGLGYQKDDGVVDTKYTRLNGSYDLGMAKVLLGYGRVSAGAARTTDWSIGADVPVSSALTVSGGYAESKDKGGEKRDGFSIAASYSLSKRTSIYGGVNYWDGKTAGVKTTDGRLYAVGIRHAF